MQTLLVEPRGEGVLLVTLNRPSAGNSLSSQMAQELLALWSADETRGQRCIVPMDAFFEPNWETDKHIRWKFRVRGDERRW